MEVLPRPLSTSSTLMLAKAIQAWMVYIWSILPAVARHSHSRYRRATMYCPLTPSFVCQQTWRAPQS
jgi:hypothetical protein